MRELTDLWWRLLVNRTDGTLRAGKRGWIFTPQELTPAEMAMALAERQALGVYAVDGHGRSRWLCLDADTKEGKGYLIELAQRFDPAVTLFEFSRRGAHLWLFCPATDWHRVQAAGHALVAGGPEGIEVFPKGPGRNGARVPLTCHPRTGERYPVVDPYTGEVRSLASLRMLHPAPLHKVAMRYERAIEPGRRQLARTS
jgi:hypothetical protein